MDLVKEARALNKRLRDVAHFFGINSVEYTTVQAEVARHIPKSLLVKNDAGVMRIALDDATKQAFEFYEDSLTTLFGKAKYNVSKIGTIYKMAKRYNPSLKSKDLNMNRDSGNYRREAEMNYHVNGEKESIYEMYMALEDAVLKAEVLKKFQARRGTKGDEADELYWQAVDATIKAVADDAKLKLEELSGENEVTTMEDIEENIARHLRR